MKIIELHEMKLVGIRVVCPDDQYVHEIPKASFQLKERLKEISYVVSPVKLVGAFVVGDYSEEEDGYWVCVEVSEINEVPEGMVSLVVPEQKYAVIRHQGPNVEIRSTYEKLHQWIEENSFERLHRSWHLEIYNEWGSPDISDIDVDLYDTIK